KGDNADIYVQLIGEGTPHRLTSNHAADFSPAWSPDGHYIAFIRDSGNEIGIFRVPALGGTERKLYSLSWNWLAQGGGLAWSPDGKFLAFSDRNSPQEPFSLLLLSPETLDRVKLTSPAALYLGDGGPAFSPDGQTLAFIRTSSADVAEIYVIPVSGG